MATILTTLFRKQIEERAMELFWAARRAAYLANQQEKVKREEEGRQAVRGEDSTHYTFRELRDYLPNVFLARREGRIIGSGAQFRDGTVVFRWMSETASTVIYSSMEDLKTVMGGLSGKSTGLVMVEFTSAVFQNEADEEDE